ncbi:hypothetical protein BCV70DRAFT_22874 [Testicularia cyperi]|uniref:Uncharacterized protein n=1 Tax=Testicularia cyperi TaxID=1882483 RepID=A0A317Y2B4_9BASI|nr:hypothetical protein BCV70DRAFT_22874 [Testicularia cyperi]
MARPNVGPRTQSNRQNAELFNAFNEPDESQLPGYDELSNTAGPSTARNVAASSPSRPSTEVFFDAGDALPEEPFETASSPVRDPLGANNARSATTPTTYRPPNLFPRAPSGSTPAYDFERPDYFPTVTRRPPATSRPGTQPSSPRTPVANDVSEHQTLDMGFDGDDSLHSTGDVGRNGYSRVPSSGFGGGDTSGRNGNGSDGVTMPGGELSRTERLRFALGRFGRFVGMGIPGARYATLSQDDGRGGLGGVGRPGVHRPRVMGGGVGQDGVFANLSAKPERRRRTQGEGGPDDRGDDDDLEENVQPPTYEVAAADAVPQYWETTILGGGGMHPLVNGLGWTPGGAHVGAVEDLIVEGLPVGNFFGFAWNLMVSMTFQFVGFLLTYLLHTTHAARCGSRAGLGVTLIQYGFYLRTRAGEIASGKINEDPFGTIVVGGGGSGDGSGDGWFEDSNEQGSLRRRVAQAAPANGNGDGATLADLFAAQGDGVPVNTGNPSLSDSMSQSTEWLAYVLMILGWFILLSSMLSYWRIHRWGQSLVAAARRDQDSSTGATTSSGGATGGDSSNADGDVTGDGTASSGPSPSSAAMSFVGRFRSALSRGGGAGLSGRSGEDWVVFPGIGHRLGGMRGSLSGGRRSRNGRDVRSASYDHPTSIEDLRDDDGLDLEDADLNLDERRLLRNMRNVGVL